MGFEPWNLKPLCASQTSYQHNYKAMTAECRHCFKLYIYPGLPVVMKFLKFHSCPEIVLKLEIVLKFYSFGQNVLKLTFVMLS